MVRTGPNSGRFPRTFDTAQEWTDVYASRVWTTPPAQIDHDIAHTHVISGWNGGSYALPAPVNTIDQDMGMIALRGHATQTVTFGQWNYGDQLPAFPDDPTKMIIISWKRFNNSFVIASTSNRDWAY